MNFRELLLAGVVVAAGMSSVEAGTIYTFSYELAGGSILSGKLDGDLQGDNDTVVVNSVSDLSFNGAPAAGSFPFLDSVTNFNIASGLPPVVSISGSLMDLLVANPAAAFDGFAFETSGVLGSPVYQAGPTFGSTFETYEPANWTLTPVPEPSSIVMFSVGALGMMFARRQRRLNKMAS